jgi:hypothetical protein
VHAKFSSELQQCIQIRDYCTGQHMQIRDACTGQQRCNRPCTEALSVVSELLRFSLVLSYIDLV